MLSDLNIRGLAVVESASLELEPGMTVLTGETGAGKSILVDALGLVLGDRADTAMVRSGQDRGEVSAVFDLAELPEARALLTEQGLDSDDECIVRRVIEAAGRSKAYINGSPVPLATLRALGEQLVDIHGQHEHQSLVRPAVQLALLDRQAGLEDALEQLAERYDAWHQADSRREALEEALGSGGERVDLLRHHVRELEALGLGDDELAELETRHDRLANAGKLLEGAQVALDASGESEDSSADAALGRALRALADLTDIDPALAEVHSLLDSARIQVDEAADSLRSYLADADLDPAELETVADRIGEAHGLARKHRVEPETLPAHLEQLRAQLDDLEHADERLAEAEAELEAERDRYREAATAVSAQRSRAAETLGAEISKLMGTLGMEGGVFEIEVSHDPDAEPRRRGLDEVSFKVSANPGQPPRPLGKVASGGELSRIGLALQVAATRATRIPVLVFDEVDSGVGGGVAEIVGRRLREIAGDRQVLCVTHLPQVASQAHQHVRVSKLSGDGHTRTQIAALDDEARVQELGRMLGGVELTEQTLAHAREMLSRAG